MVSSILEFVRHVFKMLCSMGNMKKTVFFNTIFEGSKLKNRRFTTDNLSSDFWDTPYSHFWLMLVPKWLNCRNSVHYATLRHPAFLPEFVTDMIVVNLSQPEPIQCVWNTHVVNNDATAIWRHHQYWQYLEISKIAHDPPQNVATLRGLHIPK